MEGRTVFVSDPGGVGWWARMCGGRATAAKCSVKGCRAAHTKLCDHPVEGGTCDAKICDRHATRAGPDSDLCPAHAGPPGHVP